MSKYKGTTFIFICLCILTQNCLNAREVVTFRSLDNERTVIRGELFKPKNVSKPPAIVMMHGCSGLYTRSRNLRTNSREDRVAYFGEGYRFLVSAAFYLGFITLKRRIIDLYDHMRLYLYLLV